MECLPAFVSWPLHFIHKMINLSAINLGREKRKMLVNRMMIFLFFCLQVILISYFKKIKKIKEKPKLMSCLIHVHLCCATICFTMRVYEMEPCEDLDSLSVHHLYTTIYNLSCLLSIKLLKQSKKIKMKRKSAGIKNEIIRRN